MPVKKKTTKISGKSKISKKLVHTHRRNPSAFEELGMHHPFIEAPRAKQKTTSTHVSLIVVVSAAVMFIASLAIVFMNISV